MALIQESTAVVVAIFFSNVTDYIQSVIIHVLNFLLEDKGLAFQTFQNEVYLRVTVIKTGKSTICLITFLILL